MLSSNMRMTSGSHLPPTPEITKSNWRSHSLATEFQEVPSMGGPHKPSDAAPRQASALDEPPIQNGDYQTLKIEYIIHPFYLRSHT